MITNCITVEDRLSYKTLDTHNLNVIQCHAVIVLHPLLGGWGVNTLPPPR